MFPATGYLYLVGITIVGNSINLINRKITFEDVRFHQATSISMRVQLSVMIRKGDGYFEVRGISVVAK